jgi:hypothetical protein
MTGAGGRGRSGRKKSGQGALPDGETLLGCRKVGFWFPLARKKQGTQVSTPEAGLSGQKSMSIKRTQKYAVLGVFGHFPKISKCPYAKNIIDAALSFEVRSGATTVCQWPLFKLDPRGILYIFL